MGGIVVHRRGLAFLLAFCALPIASQSCAEVDDSASLTILVTHDDTARGQGGREGQGAGSGGVSGAGFDGSEPGADAADEAPTSAEEPDDAGAPLDAQDEEDKGEDGESDSGDAGLPEDDGGDVDEPPPPPCPTDMALVESFCMDRYEAPNEPGAAPLAMATAPEGEAWCEARGKRLCREDEWLRACEGEEGRKYPYGNTYQAHACNDDKVWRSPSWTTLGTWPSEAAKAEAAALYQADPSGERQACVSQEGVFDLTGNVAEWVVRSFPNANNYEHVMKGCYWSKCYGGSNPSCAFVNPAHPGTFRTYEAGFRCCKDVE